MAVDGYYGCDCDKYNPNCRCYPREAHLSEDAPRLYRAHFRALKDHGEVRWDDDYADLGDAISDLSNSVQTFRSGFGHVSHMGETVATVDVRGVLTTQDGE